MAAPPSSAPGPAQVAPRAGLALALLLAINLFNYIDRQVLSAVLSKLELDADLFSPHDRWIGLKLGSLTTAFMVSLRCDQPECDATLEFPIPLETIQEAAGEATRIPHDVKLAALGGTSKAFDRWIHANTRATDVILV